jgi:hypothetical protein
MHKYARKQLRFDFTAELQMLPKLNSRLWNESAFKRYGCWGIALPLQRLKCERLRHLSPSWDEFYLNMLLILRLCVTVGRWWIEHGTLVEWYWQGKAEVLRENLHPIASLSTTNPTWTGLWSNPGLLGDDSLASNRFRHDIWPCQNYCPVIAPDFIKAMLK